ncbi:SPOR domain-containing protein [Uliginosibacterium sp. H3]|uniref:SPOR domain-containing protein n=1 Tax=Uliginosibacterium silvisoli TaxID=3114758 RepID=A0ABU6K8Z5_9RHOO|nr:SPOR domain-containing protein [Uliginosibacterium sp. H3]
MTEQVKADQAREAAAEARQVRRQLIVKGGIAAIAVAGLVVALVLLEGNHEEEPAPTARTVTPTGVTAPEAQSPSLAEATTQALRTSKEAAELQSVVLAEQQAVASAVAAVPAVPEESAEPLGIPPLQASAPISAAGTSARRREGGGRLVLEQSPPRGAQVAAASSAAAVKAPAPVVTPAPAKAPTAAASASAAGDFFVQVGVFANPGNAEELRARLKGAGIPTQVETRVQVGPFNTRQEAVAAQARLKSLGMDGGMVVPARH